MKPFGYVWHAESDCAFPVYSEEEAQRCCDQGAEMVSEYFCTMVELGLYELIDHEWDAIDESYCCCGSVVGEGGSICAHGGCVSAKHYYA
jgi:hypothetical protein